MGGTSTKVITPIVNNLFFDGEVINNPDQIEVYLYNALGSLIAVKRSDIDMSGYPHGVYIVKSKSNAFKIVK